MPDQITNNQRVVFAMAIARDFFTQAMKDAKCAPHLPGDLFISAVLEIGIWLKKAESHLPPPCHAFVRDCLRFAEMEIGRTLAEAVGALDKQTKSLKDQLESYEIQSSFEGTLLDDLADAYAEIRKLKDLAERHSWLCGHAAGLSDSLAEARNTIARLQFAEVQP